MTKKLLTAALLGASMMAAAPAYAVDFPLNFVGGTAAFGTEKTTGTYTGATADRYFFTLASAFTLTNGFIGSTQLDPPGTVNDRNFNFTSVTLQRYTVNPAVSTTAASFAPTSPDPFEMRVLLPVTLAAGNYFLNVEGTVPAPTPAGSYAGNLNIAAIAAVPEPATWALMALGFGLVGTSLRSRRRSVVTA